MMYPRYHDHKKKKTCKRNKTFNIATTMLTIAIKNKPEMKVIMMYPRYHDHKKENLQKEQNISISSPGFVKLRIRFNSTQSLRASLQLIRAVCVPK